MLRRANRVNSRPAARWGATTAAGWTDQGQAGLGEAERLETADVKYFGFQTLIARVHVHVIAQVIQLPVSPT